MYLDLDTLLDDEDSDQTKEFCLKIIAFAEGLRAARGSWQRREVAISAAHQAIADLKTHLDLRRFRAQLNYINARGDNNTVIMWESRIAAHIQKMTDTAVRKWNGFDNVYVWTCLNVKGRMYNEFTKDKRRQAINLHEENQIVGTLHPSITFSGGSAEQSTANVVVILEILKEKLAYDKFLLDIAELLLTSPTISFPEILSLLGADRKTGMMALRDLRRLIRYETRKQTPRYHNLTTIKTIQNCTPPPETLPKAQE